MNLKLNPKVNKLRQEYEKNSSTIQKLTARNEEVEREVTRLENEDIIGLVRSVDMTPEQLAELIQRAQRTEAAKTAEPVKAAVPVKQEVPGEKRETGFVRPNVNIQQARPAEQRNFNHERT